MFTLLAVVSPVENGALKLSRQLSHYIRVLSAVNIVHLHSFSEKVLNLQLLDVI